MPPLDSDLFTTAYVVTNDGTTVRGPSYGVAVDDIKRMEYVASE